MEQLHLIHFQIVLEINPFDFTDEEYPYRTDFNVENRHKFWQKTMTKAGLKHVKPIELGSYFVDISRLRDTELQIVLNTHLDRHQADDFFEEMPCLSGGIILYNGKDIIARPQCCTDISDSYNWLEINTSEKVKQLWIGHPWLFYKTQEEDLLLSRYIEKNAEELQAADWKYKINLKLLRQELETLEEKIEGFYQSVQKGLEALGCSNIMEIAGCLVKNER